MNYDGEQHYNILKTKVSIEADGVLLTFSILSLSKTAEMIKISN